MTNMNGINTNLNSEGSITALVGSDNFVNLDSNLQGKIIDSMNEEKAQRGGFMGTFLGTDPTNVSMHIALILCGLLVLLLAIDFIHAYCTGQEINMELVSQFIPVVTLSLGYIFGKGSS